MAANYSAQRATKVAQAAHPLQGARYVLQRNRTFVPLPWKNKALYNFYLNTYKTAHPGTPIRGIGTLVALCWKEGLVS